MNHSTGLNLEIFSRITEAFLALDKNFCFTYSNQKNGELLGRDPKELIGKSIWDVFPDLINLATSQALKTALDAQHSISQTDFYPSLKCWLECHIYPSPDGLSVLLSDVTEAKRAEHQFQQSYEEMHRLITHLLEQGEQERTMIAKKLHDDVGQQLTVLKMDLAWLNKHIQGSDDRAGEKIKNLLGLTDKAIQTVRKISSELRPSMLEDLGLAEALENLCYEFEKRTDIKTIFTSGLDYLQLSGPVSTGLFRILQEGLTNVERHAKATRVNVSLQKQNDQLFLKIQDNGIGFEVNSMENKKTLGILRIREQTNLIGGKYLLHSNPGEGTRMEIIVLIKSE